MPQLLLAVPLIDLLVIPSEAVVAEALLGVPALGAVFGIALLAVVKLLHVHAADLAEWQC